MVTTIGTVEELTEKLVKLQNDKDEAAARFRDEMRTVRSQRDAAIARDAAKAKVERMSDDEKAAIAAELGLEA